MSAEVNIPGYQLLSRIAEGGTSTVWRARQESLDREVAIKILHQQFAADTEEVQAFIREAHAVAKLDSHHIIRIIDVGQYSSVIYLVMEYVDGYPVQRLISKERPLSQKQALKIALSVADALKEAWQSQKIIHRDIKPDNIILDRKGEVKVADMGLAGIVDHKGHLVGEDDGVIAGTPNYMSPEQAAGSNTMNYSADMYSLGAVLYHMLTGHMPFEGRSTQRVLEAQIDEQIPCPRDLNPKISVSCAQLITRMMMKNPEDRHGDWDSVINDMQRIMDGRMLIMKFAPEGISTVAPRQEPAEAAVRPGLRTAGSTATRSGGDRGSAPPDGSPLIRALCNGALAICLAWIFFSLIWAPHRSVPSPTPVAPPAPPPTTDQSGTQRRQTPVRLETHQTAPRQTQRPDSTPTATPTDGFAVLEIDRNVQLRHQNQDALAAPSGTGARYTAPETPADQAAAELLNILRNSIIHIAVSDGIPAAAALFEQQRSEPSLANAERQLNEMEFFLHPDNHPQTLLADAFRKLIGRETYVNVGNRRVDFRVEAVNAHVISTLVKVPGNNGKDYPAELKLEVLEPAEQRRWLARSSSPEAAFCIAILDLQTENFAGAIEQSAACGPFAEPIRQYATRRMPQAEY